MTSNDHVDEYLSAIPCTPQEGSCSSTAFEETETSILLRGSDKSGLKRIIYFQIESIPNNGILFEEGHENEPLEVGTLLKYHPH